MKIKFNLMLNTSPSYKGKIKSIYFQIKNLRKQKFVCPICSYNGPFTDITPSTGTRIHAKCPSCGSLERHRLQKLVLSKIFHENTCDISKLKVLHFAPEPFFEKIFRSNFKNYLTADLYAANVDIKCDIASMPFQENEFDLVYASHVLEHVRDDLKALAEIKRVLTPKGIAILPVPIVGKTTVEYLEPNPNESFHVRAPGEDYYDRYENIFNSVEKFYSKDFPEKYQLYLYEDRSVYPNSACPMRQPTQGERHMDIIPVCLA